MPKWLLPLMVTLPVNPSVTATSFYRLIQRRLPVPRAVLGRWLRGMNPHLVDLVEQGVIAKGRTLEVGCGTGTNAIWLSSRGFEVYGVDLAPRAIEAAQAKARAEAEADA